MKVSHLRHRSRRSLLERRRDCNPRAHCLCIDQRSNALNQRRLSECLRSSKTKTPVTTPAPAEQAPPVMPVVAQATGEVGRTIVDIARKLKITPQNARRIARNHTEALGHAGKGARWFLNADQEKALRDAVTRELTRSRVRFRGKSRHQQWHDARLGYLRRRRA